MRRPFVILGIGVFSLTVFGADPLQEQLSKEQLEKVEQQLQQIYEPKSDEDFAKAMNQKVPKYNVRSGKQVERNKHLLLQNQQQKAEYQQELQKEKIDENPLIQQAQVKATQQFIRHECVNSKRQQGKTKQVAQKECENLQTGRAGTEANDKIELLTKTWMAKPIRSLDEIAKQNLNKGSTAADLWSDDYWALAYGATSFRYANPKQPDKTNYLKSVTSFLQPNLWNAKEAKMKHAPSELYDITVGDVGDGKTNIAPDMTNADEYKKIPGFTLTRQQKLEGWDYWLATKKVEEWMGICHGWAPAAIIVPNAQKVVTVKGYNNQDVVWNPHDIRALASLAWANASTPTNFVGGRCNVKEPALDKKIGRLKQQDCFDNNPATFHLALANLIGKEKTSFVMDKTFDYEVWNQPVQSYEFTYFNPLNPSQRDKDWKKVAVKYWDVQGKTRNAAFAKKDKFQNGEKNYRGITSRKNRESEIVSVVGVVAKVSYLVEVEPQHGDPGENALDEVVYTYDLELYREDAKKADSPLIADGGEWHNNTHPDFLWVPQKGKKAQTPEYDRLAKKYDGKLNADITKAAKVASQDGYPLCSVLGHLVKQSSEGKKDYVCN